MARKGNLRLGSMGHTGVAYVGIIVSLAGRHRLLYARLAQLGERLPYKQGVGGSSPSAGT